MSQIYVDTINEKTTGNGVYIPGHVVQVVQSTATTSASTTGSSFVATNLSANITPSSSSSKIYIMVTGRLGNTSASGGADLAVFRDSTNLGITSGRLANQYFDRAGSNFNSAAFVYLDSPSTSSQITYEVRIRSGGSGSTASFDQAQIIVLMEIAG